MAVTETDYTQARDVFLADLSKVEALERKYMDFLVRVTLDAADDLYADFDRANQLLPFWLNYPPKQRGRSPMGDSIPWSEVGEKSLSSNLLRAIEKKSPGIRFPGLPFGGDVRFATDDALIHFDVKMTGPRDNVDEVVAPPQQISGDGCSWNSYGVANTSFVSQGPQASMAFYPKLPPFYILDGSVKVCLTYFLKAVYDHGAGGHQPLKYMEIACVPNGLLLLNGPKYANTPGLFIPGKDDKKKDEQDLRTRVRLNPLVGIGDWRCCKVKPDEEPVVVGTTKWHTAPRVPAPLPIPGTTRRRVIRTAVIAPLSLPGSTEE